MDSFFIGMQFLARLYATSRLSLSRCGASREVSSECLWGEPERKEIKKCSRLGEIKDFLLTKGETRCEKSKDASSACMSFRLIFGVKFFRSECFLIAYYGPLLWKAWWGGIVFSRLSRHLFCLIFRRWFYDLWEKFLFEYQNFQAQIWFENPFKSRLENRDDPARRMFVIFRLMYIFDAKKICATTMRARNEWEKCNSDASSNNLLTLIAFSVFPCSLLFLFSYRLISSAFFSRGFCCASLLSPEKRYKNSSAFWLNSIKNSLFSGLRFSRAFKSFDAVSRGSTTQNFSDEMEIFSEFFLTRSLLRLSSLLINKNVFYLIGAEISIVRADKARWGVRDVDKSRNHRKIYLINCPLN